MKNLITSATDTRIKNSNAGVNDLVWLYRQKTVIFMHLISMAIALLVPIDAISSFSFLGRVVDGVLSVIPMGRNFSVKSSFPELVQIYSAAMIFFIPPLIAFHFRLPGLVEMKKRTLKIMGESKAKILLIRFLLIFIVTSLLVVLFFVKGSEFSLAPFLTSKFFLGAVGPVIFCIFPALMICLFFVVLDVLNKFWRNKNV
jgi:hypothetical protein